MKLTLPELVEFSCPHCERTFGVAAVHLEKRTLLTCPLCQGEFSLVEGLPTELRREFYYRLRGLLEHRFGERFYALYQELLSEFGSGRDSPL